MNRNVTKGAVRFLPSAASQPALSFPEKSI